MSKSLCVPNLVPRKDLSNGLGGQGINPYGIIITMCLQEENPPHTTHENRLHGKEQIHLFNHPPCLVSHCGRATRSLSYLNSKNNGGHHTYAKFIIYTSYTQLNPNEMVS